MKEKETMKMAGVCVFKSQAELSKYGYYEPVANHPVVVYSKTGELKDNLFYKPQDPNSFAIQEIEDTKGLKFLPENLCETQMSIDEAQDCLPEIFL